MSDSWGVSLQVIMRVFGGVLVAISIVVFLFGYKPKGKNVELYEDKLQFFKIPELLDKTSQTVLDDKITKVRAKFGEQPCGSDRVNGLGIEIERGQTEAFDWECPGREIASYDILTSVAWFISWRAIHLFLGNRVSKTDGDTLITAAGAPELGGMLSQELIQDLDMSGDFLNIDSFFANNDDVHDDLWPTPRHSLNASNDDDDWFGSEALDPLVQDPEEDTMVPQTKQLIPVKQLASPSKPMSPSVLSPSSAARKRHVDDIKEEPLEVDEDENEDKDEDQCKESHCCGYVQRTDQDESMDLLDGSDDDDGAWLAFADSPLVSPSSIAGPRKLSNDKLVILRPTNAASVNIKQEEEQFLLPDETDYSLPDLTDDDVTGLVGSPSSSSMCSPSSYIRDAMPRNNSSSSVLISPPPFTNLNSPLSMVTTPKVPLAGTLGSAPSNSIVVSEKDIPDMVNLFSSMHSPSEAATHRTHPQQPPPPTPTANGNAPLSILVPVPHMYATMFPFSTTAAGAASFAAAAANNNSNQFDYFTPPGFTNASNRYMDGSQLNPAIFLSAETLSPATKGTIFPGHAAVTANGALQSHAPTQAQVQTHVNAATAAAVAMANSVAAISTMRKLNATYGVPIAPLQRSLHPELKPKLAVSASMPPILAAASSSSSSATKTLASSARLASITASSVSSSASASKVTKISITPDISDFKLVQIFHQFCDPAAKLITLPRFHQLLQHHQVKDDSSTHSASAKTAPGGTANNSGITKSTAVVPSQETQALFKVLDPTGAGFIDLEKFMNSFQICNRCTEAKRRAHTAHCASQGQSFVSTALERQLMEDVAPVIVRVVPTSYEGSKVKSCEHYQWTWCEGFEKTGNEKCRGTNRHDKCPKYLANCTLWKHKLPPKNRKAKVFENQDSPSKKFKHFA